MLSIFPSAAFKMLKLNLIQLLLLGNFIGIVLANLEGPFLFWGPKELSLYKRPALTSLEQDDLVEIYENQAAIVVFNNQDSFPLTSESFPRLRKLLERKTMLVLPQDFLDVHPEYINNETQVITVQGPSSERDAEITETFERLEDIYGAGRVLGVLGTSSSQEVETLDEEEGLELEGRRRRRQAGLEPKEAPAEVVYNGSGKILFYSSDYLHLKYASGDNRTEDKTFKLQSLAGVTSDEREQFSRLIVTFSTVIGRVTLRFRFPDLGTGYWTLGPVELLDSRGQEFLLAPRPHPAGFLGAPRGFSFRCSQPLVFSNGSISLHIQEIQVQPQMNFGTRFGMAYNCIGFTTAPIWSGILVTFLLIAGTFLGISMISNIKTPDKFENSKGKTLTFTVNE